MAEEEKDHMIENSISKTVESYYHYTHQYNLARKIIFFFETKFLC